MADNDNTNKNIDIWHILVGDGGQESTKRGIRKFSAVKAHVRERIIYFVPFFGNKIKHSVEFRHSACNFSKIWRCVGNGISY